MTTPDTGNLSISARSSAILGHIVEAYVETGAPVGSKTLSAKLGMQLSPATIRSVMADLERCGLLYAPHTSAGRLPTEAGLRYFVHGLLETGNLNQDIARQIADKCQTHHKNPAKVMDDITVMLSGLSRCAGLVLAPKIEEAVRHIEFIGLSADKALVVLVFASGAVENRIIDLPPHVRPAQMAEAAAFLNEKLYDKTLEQAAAVINETLRDNQTNLDTLTANLVKNGLAVWTEDSGSRQTLIVRGRANLLNDITELKDVERVRHLFTALETQQSLAGLLQAIRMAEGVQIFIGAESELFSIAGCSLIVAPFKNTSNSIVGALGIIGPTRLNYGKVIPMVDFTARMISHVLAGDVEKEKFNGL